LFDFVKTRFLILLLLVSTIQLAAQQIQRSLKWEAPRKINISKYDVLELPWFHGAQYIEEPRLAPWFLETIPIAKDGSVQSARLENVQWENVLRSVAGERAYRWLNAGRMDPRGIAEFLILDADHDF
jgi:hypothetical protein